LPAGLGALIDAAIVTIAIRHEKRHLLQVVIPSAFTIALERYVTPTVAIAVGDASKVTAITIRGPHIDAPIDKG
jgi:hypothetical protein